MDTDASGLGELEWLVVLDEVYPGAWEDLALTLRVATSIFDELAAPAPSVPMLYALVAVWQRCEPRMRARASRRFRETIVAMAIEEPDLPPVFWRRAPRVLAWLRIADERRLFCASA